jgi:hypothetical protein
VTGADLAIERAIHGHPGSDTVRSTSSAKSVTALSRGWQPAGAPWSDTLRALIAVRAGSKGVVNKNQPATVRLVTA